MDRKARAILSDEEIVRRFRGGDEEAFDQLVLRYRKDVYRVAYRITANHAEADDLAQETFCRAYQAFGSFRGEAALRTWLLRIASNLSLNVVQSARVTRREPTVPEQLAEAGVVGAVQLPVGADDLERRERDRLLRVAIRSLPRRQQMTLILRAFEGLAYKEIAEVMQCTTGTAKANFFHAVAALRKSLREFG